MLIKNNTSLTSRGSLSLSLSLCLSLSRARSRLDAALHLPARVTLHDVQPLGGGQVRERDAPVLAVRRLIHRVIRARAAPPDLRLLVRVRQRDDGLVARRAAGLGAGARRQRAAGSDARLRLKLDGLKEGLGAVARVRSGGG